MAEIIGRLVSGRYRVESFLGKGAMAEVYRVWDMERNVYLAMKVLNADLAEDRVFLRRFKREANTLSTLHHPNIVRFYGMERDGDLVYMLMDYVDGGTLRKEIFQGEEPFSLERILEVMRSVCAALYYAHKLGFVHCDVKPANIMIHRNGTILIADFGISRVTEASTATMIGAGTPAYMSPEQIKGSDPMPQMDIYALGVVLFEMLTGGERPFTGDNAKTTGTNSEKVRWEQLRLQSPPPSKYNPAVTPDIDAVVLKCLDKVLHNRYRDAMDVYHDLHKVVNPAEPSNPVQTPIQRTIQDPVAESTQPALTSIKSGKVIRKVNSSNPLIWVGGIAIGGLCISIITVGGALSLYLGSISTAETATMRNWQVTETHLAANLYATATKHENYAQATATEHSSFLPAIEATQSYEATSVALHNNEITNIAPFHNFKIGLGISDDCSGDQLGEIFTQGDLFINDWDLYIFWPSTLSLSQYSPKLSLFNEQGDYLFRDIDLDLRLDENSCAWHLLGVDEIKPGKYTVEIISNGKEVFKKNILIIYSDLTVIPRPERPPLGQFTIGTGGVDNKSCKVVYPAELVSADDLKESEWFYFASPFRLAQVGKTITWSLYYNDTVKYYYREQRVIADDIDLCFWQGFSLDGASPGKYTLEIELSDSGSDKYEFVFYLE